MKVESSYIGAKVNSTYTLTRRLAYTESMAWGLYQAECSYCGCRPLIWVELDTARWRWERMCLEVHEVRNHRGEQRLARLLACAA
jgi:hypothetical protein